MMEILLGLSDVLQPALLALLGAVLFFAATYLRNQAQAIENEHLRAAAIGVIDRAESEVYASVAYVMQTYVDDLKAASADGTLTAEEQREAALRAVRTFKERMGVHGVEQLAAVVGDVDEWIRSQLEATIHTMGKSS